MSEAVQSFAARARTDRAWWLVVAASSSSA